MSSGNGNGNGAVVTKQGRPRREVDMEAVLDLLNRGEKVPTIANELQINPVTLRARIAEIQKEQGLLLQYRSIQSLQLTALQARVLEAITPEKINEAPLKDLVMSFKILKDKELVLEHKPSEVKGLVAHLIYLEKQEAALKDGKAVELLDGEYKFNDSTNEEIPEEEGGRDGISLSDLDTQEF